jgi:hypothetical protein
MLTTFTELILNTAIIHTDTSMGQTRLRSAASAVKAPKTQDIVYNVSATLTEEPLGGKREGETCPETSSSLQGSKSQLQLCLAGWHLAKTIKGKEGLRKHSLGAPHWLTIAMFNVVQSS